MNYGYDNSTRLWKEDRKQQLADRLSEAIKPLVIPYVEVDQLYGGVRIRRIGDLSNAQRAALITCWDAIYDAVMG
jgi:hypothetical protein